jgi:hypothetical protein
MTQIKNIFAKGTIQKDLDSRFVSPEELIDAENAIVITSEGSNAGVLKNVTGNIKKTNLNIAGAKTIGHGVLSSKNKVYNLVAGSLYDYIIETDVVSWNSIIVAQSSIGKLLNFNRNKRVTNVDIIIDPEGNGDLLCFSGDSNPPRCLNIETAKTWGVDGFSEQEISLIKAPPSFPITLTPLISTENPESNFLQDRFLSFAYRYKYTDGQYSAISTWSEYFFVPGDFNIDFDTFENLGMLNIYNAVNLTFNTGPRDVVGVDLIFKYSNEYTPYIIDKFIKADQVWGNDQNITIEFNNSKVYAVLPESEFYRSYDNVPQQAVAQAVIGNRIAFGNYIEDRDLIDADGSQVLMDYTLSLVATNLVTGNLDVTTETKNYTFETPSVDVANGLMSFDLGGIALVKGFTLFINFDITSNPLDLNFNKIFSYILEDDYTDVTDLLTNSGFVDALEVQFSNYFENNGGVSFPDDYVPPYVIEKGFDVSNLGSIMLIDFPVVKYEIDETPDPNTFVYDYFADTNTIVSYRNIARSTSLKSIRSYEICQIFLDPQGRKTTALVSNNNTLFIPIANSITQNQIKVTIPSTQKVPVGFNRYKFSIKQNRGHYEQIIANLFFEDGEYRWIKMDGVNRNKVKEDDILTVKKDSNGPLFNLVQVKVLEVIDQPKNFIEGNVDTGGSPISEPAGLYFKIKPTNFEIKYDPNEFQRYTNRGENVNDRVLLTFGGLKRFDGVVFVDIPLKQGSLVSLKINNIQGGADESTFIDKNWAIQDDYDSFEDWWNAVVVSELPFIDNGYSWNDIYFEGVGQRYLKVLTPLDPSFPIFSVADGVLEIRSVDGFFIFETQPIEITNDVFYETPETYNIVDGEYEFTEHTLTKAFNCISFGNGAESYQIRDAFNGKELVIDFCPTAVSEDGYRQVRRFKDITYSGIYNSNTNVNELNAFNLSLANFKDDMESNYGPIYKMRGKDTNLEVCQEDRDSIVFYGKDMLFNADGTTNLSRIQEVLGQQKVYDGEYGISTHADSYDYYENTSYHTDFKRGVVVKKGGNGLFEISSLGMRTYFKKLFRDNTINEIIGRYDQFYDYYLLNIKYTDKNGVSKYVTWAFSDKVNGWLTRITFNPEDMCRVNSQFISFKNGEVWLHNQDTLFNTFYGVQTDSRFKFNFSQEPSTRKIHKAISIEGTTNLQISCETDLEKGYINNVDFEKKEGVWYAYVRGKNGELNTSQLSFQGIGNAVISGLDLRFAFPNGDVIDPIISVGDVVLNSNLQIVGTILSKTTNSLTLDTVNNIVSGDFVLATKPESVQKQGLLGYFMQVEASFSSNTQQEIYALNAEVIKSYI